MNTTKVDLWGAKTESSQGFAIFFVVLASVVGLLNAVFPALVARWLNNKLKDTAKTAWWVVPLVCIGFLGIGAVAGAMFTSARKDQSTATSPPPSPTPTPTATPTPVSSPISTSSPIDDKTKLSPSTAAADNPNSSRARDAPPAVASPTPFDLSIADVQVQGRGEGDRVADISDTLIVKVKNLKDELDRERTQAASADRFNAYAYVLFLNDVEMKKLYPTALDPDAGALHFQLGRTAESQDAWNHLLTLQSGSSRTTKASIGLEGKPPMPKGQNFSLRVYRPVWLVAFLIILILILLVFIYSVRKTLILREGGLDLGNEGWPRRFSLARVQFAWWMFIIVGSLLFLTVVTGSRVDPGRSALVLLALSSATALSATLIDLNRVRSSRTILDQLQNRRQRLTSSMSVTASDSKEQKLSEVDEEIADRVSALRRRTSNGLIPDLLKDRNGFSLFRLQLIVWTIGMGLLFLTSAVANLQMPEFGISWLLFTVISAAIYVIFKSQETLTEP